MSREELVQEVVRAGGRVRWSKGAAKIVARLPDEVVLEIKAQRDGFLAAWDRHEAGERAARGWGVAPVREPSLMTKPPAWNAAGYRRMDAWARRQPGEVQLWVIQRAGVYAKAKPDWPERAWMMAAIDDLWGAQMGRNHEKPEQVVAGCEEAYG